jgi:hypothetical protein
MTGAMSSAILVSVIAMLGDITEGLPKREKALVLSRLPLVAVGGLAAPAAQEIMKRFGYEASVRNVMTVSGGAVALIALVALLLLNEVRMTVV